MKTSEWLKSANAQLNKAGIGTARLDCLVLLEDCFGKDRAYLLANPDTELSSTQVSQLNKKIKQRAQHRPLSYIRKRTEFYGRNFYIDQHVLEPRPESETMISLLKKIISSNNQCLIDVGTGSGALGITAKLEFPQNSVDLVDIDRQTLIIARRNAKQLAVPVRCYISNLLSKAHSDYDIILANLPYVPDDYIVNRAALNEPPLAIFGGKDGLDLYRQLWSQIGALTHQPSFVLTESLPFQHSALTKIASHESYSLQITDDFIQVFQPVV